MGRISRIVGVVAGILAMGGVNAHAATPDLVWSGVAWHVKTGMGALGQQWAASHVADENGILTITDSDGVGGGVRETIGHTYGTYSVRYRMSAGAGSKYAILLWPDKGTRPEIDFAEDSMDDAARTMMVATWHPGLACLGCVQVWAAGDFTQWHTATVEWTPTGVTFLVDGTVTGSVAATSTVRMHLSIQTFAFAPGPVTTLEVESVSES